MENGAELVRWKRLKLYDTITVKVSLCKGIKSFSKIIKLIYLRELVIGLECSSRLISGRIEAANAY